MNKILYTNFKKQVQNIVKYVQRNIVLWETTFFPPPSIPEVNKNTLYKTKH